MAHQITPMHLRDVEQFEDGVLYTRPASSFATSDPDPALRHVALVTGPRGRYEADQAAGNVGELIADEASLATELARARQLHPDEDPYVVAAARVTELVNG